MKPLGLSIVLSAIALRGINDPELPAAKPDVGGAHRSHWSYETTITDPNGLPYDDFGAFVALRNGVALVGSSRNVFRADYANGVFAVTSAWFDADFMATFYPRVALSQQGPHLQAFIGDRTARADLGTVRVHSPATQSGSMTVIPGARTHTGFASELRVDGKYMVVSAPYDADGRVYLFERRPAGWTQLHVFRPPVGWNGTFFGISADVLDHSSGLFVAIGGADGTSGGAFVYQREGGGFPLEATLSARHHAGVLVRLGAGDYPFLAASAEGGSHTVTRTFVQSFHRSAAGPSPWIEGASIQADEDITLRDVDGRRVVVLQSDNALTYDSLGVSSWALSGEATGAASTHWATSVALDGDMMLVGVIDANDGRGLARLYSLEQ